MYSKETKKRTLTEVKGDTDGREGWAVPAGAIPDSTLALGAWRSHRTRRCEKRVFPSKMALAVGRGETGERAGWTEIHTVAQWPQQVRVPQRAIPPPFSGEAPHQWGSAGLRGTRACLSPRPLK